METTTDRRRPISLRSRKPASTQDSPHVRAVPSAWLTESSLILRYNTAGALLEAAAAGTSRRRDIDLGGLFERSSGKIGKDLGDSDAHAVNDKSRRHTRAAPNGAKPGFSRLPLFYSSPRRTLTQ